MALAVYDAELRAAAFAFLDAAIRREGDTLSWRTLNHEFFFRGELIKLVAPSRGIHKPAQLADAPLSIVTAPPKPGRSAPYEDALDADGVLTYHYQGDDPDRYDNRYLRTAFVRRLPLVYFIGIAKGLYLPLYPVYIIEDRVDELLFRVSTSQPVSALVTTIDRVAEPTRRYGEVTVLSRLHQAAFRQRVLRAYQEACAICRLRRVELVEAAHILPDRHVRGIPTVDNGVALCRLHHAAFDRLLIGIRPDLVVEVREDVLAEKDGPMLEHGLKAIDRQKIWVPGRAAERPSRAALEERYEMFKTGAFV
ncbi:HNH endonuclease [Myxococcota bacterium]|nr:HNH endonuclease [Myxococcota bacterium]